MIVVKFSGGLGNQIYQYLIYRIMQELYPEVDVRGDVSFYNILNEHNGFEIENVFDVEPIIWATKYEIEKIFSKYIPGRFAKKLPTNIKRKLVYSWQYKISKIRKVINNRKQTGVVVTGYEINVYNPLIKNLNVENNSFYLDGLWQNKEYFTGYEDKICGWLKYKLNYTEKEMQLSDKIKDCNSVSIHVRRGDFVNSTLDICNIEYYKKAVELMKSKVDDPFFFIFTDDYKYVSENFSWLKKKLIVSGSTQKAIYDMMLMSECKHNIMSNSTFSFWGGFLNNNKDKIVIAPRYCVVNTIGKYEFSLPDAYIKIDV